MQDVVSRAISCLKEAQEQREKAQEALRRKKSSKNIRYCRNELSFTLARFLQGADITFKDSLPYAEEYWRQIVDTDLNSDPNSALDDFEEFMEDLEISWDSVKCPDGQGLKLAIERARQAGTPTEALKISNKDTCFLAALCRELQLLRPDKKFRFTQKLAGKAINRNRSAGARKLAILEKHGIIERTFIGSSGFASEYIYRFTENFSSQS